MLAQAWATIITLCETQAVGKSANVFIFTFLPPRHAALRTLAEGGHDTSQTPQTAQLQNQYAQGIPKASSINSNHKLAS